MNTMSLENKTIVVTGAAGGMGRATVDMLLKAGANVVACDLNTDSLETYQSFKNFLSFAGNLVDEHTVTEVFQKAHQKFGSIDGLANIAGIAQSAAPIDEVSLEQYDLIMNVNMKMVFLTCREAAKYMKKQKRGKIVNIGSVAATRPRPGLQSYVASKGAVESFTKALALELAEHHINANVLHPGPADTSMLAKFTKAGGDVKSTRKEVFESSVPLGRLIQPEDIARSVKFLLSDEAEMITGAVLHVDGGRNI